MTGHGQPLLRESEKKNIRIIHVQSHRYLSHQEWLPYVQIYIYIYTIHSLTPLNTDGQNISLSLSFSLPPLLTHSPTHTLTLCWGGSGVTTPGDRTRSSMDEPIVRCRGKHLDEPLRAIHGGSLEPRPAERSMSLNMLPGTLEVAKPLNPRSLRHNKTDT